MTTLNGKGQTKVTPDEAIASLAKVVAAIEAEVVFSTCIDDDGFVAESECFASDSQPKNLLPVEELFYLACELGAPEVMITSRASGPLTHVQECDVDFTARVIAAGRELGIGVLDHVLADKDGYRLMSEAVPHLWR